MLRPASIACASLLEQILHGEEESADWLESQLHLVEQLGAKHLAEQIHD